MENSAYASISGAGVLTTLAVPTNKRVTLTVSYGRKSTNKVVTILNY